MYLKNLTNYKDEITRANFAIFGQFQNDFKILRKYKKFWRKIKRIKEISLKFEKAI